MDPLTPIYVAIATFIVVHNISKACSCDVDEIAKPKPPKPPKPRTTARTPEQIECERRSLEYWGYEPRK